MPVVVIAIGNRLMGDDAVAVHVAEELKESLEFSGIKVIIGETDVDYCLSNIELGEFIVLLDATWFGIAPGTVTMHSLKDIRSFKTNHSLFSQHGYNLVSAIKAFTEAAEVVLIGIEGLCFDFGLALSAPLEVAFEEICCEVNEKILNSCHILN